MDLRLVHPVRVVYVPFILFSIHSVIFPRLSFILCSAAPLKLPTLSEVEAVSEEQSNPLTPSTTHHCRLLSALVASVDRSKSQYCMRSHHFKLTAEYSPFWPSILR